MACVILKGRESRPPAGFGVFPQVQPATATVPDPGAIRVGLVGLAQMAARAGNGTPLARVASGKAAAPKGCP